jgi:hypothetical protein
MVVPELVKGDSRRPASASKERDDMRGTVVGAFVVKFAVRETLEFRVTEQKPVPEQDPLQPEKVEPASAVGVREREVPEFTTSEQSDPQLIPAPETEPLPVPDLETERV